MPFDRWRWKLRAINCSNKASNSERGTLNSKIGMFNSSNKALNFKRGVLNSERGMFNFERGVLRLTGSRES